METTEIISSRLNNEICIYLNKTIDCYLRIHYAFQKQCIVILFKIQGEYCDNVTNIPLIKTKDMDFRIHWHHSTTRFCEKGRGLDRSDKLLIGDDDLMVLNES